MAERIKRWQNLTLHDIFFELELFIGQEHKQGWDLKKRLSRKELLYLKNRIEEYYPKSCCLRDVYHRADADGSPWGICGTCDLAQSLYLFIMMEVVNNKEVDNNG